MSNIKFSDYTLDNLKKFLEQKLYIKLSKIGVKTIGDFEKLTLSEFSSHKGIGTNAIKLFLDFKIYFNNNKLSIYDKIKEDNDLKILPISEFEFVEDLNDPDLLDLFEGQDSQESDDRDKMFTVGGMTNDKEQTFNEFQKKQDEFDERDLNKDGIVSEEEKRKAYEKGNWKNAHKGKAYFQHPWFDWSKKERWINDRDAINYWLNVKGGNRNALSQIRNQYPDNFDSKTY